MTIPVHIATGTTAITTATAIRIDAAVRGHTNLSRLDNTGNIGVGAELLPDQVIRLGINEDLLVAVKKAAQALPRGQILWRKLLSRLLVEENDLGG